MNFFQLALSFPIRVLKPVSKTVLETYSIHALTSSCTRHGSHSIPASNDDAYIRFGKPAASPFNALSN